MQPERDGRVHCSAWLGRTVVPSLGQIINALPLYYPLNDWPKPHARDAAAKVSKECADTHADHQVTSRSKAGRKGDDEPNANRDARQKRQPSESAKPKKAAQRRRLPVKLLVDPQKT